ncbi:MAG: hypothetical protein JRI34_09160 [Deltaproteobacteria bacterium]|nr:hypothetical protein [Deltaproteobacteria bacterium]
MQDRNTKLARIFSRMLADTREQMMKKDRDVPILHKDGSWQDLPEGQNEVFILAKNGLFRFRRVMILTHCLIEAVTKVGEGGVYFLQGQREYIKLNMPKKLPLAMVQQITSFFGDVTDSHGTEAVMPVFYSPFASEFQFQAVPPARITSLSSAGIEFRHGATPSRFVKLCEVHSHANMAAFHSGTDDHDETSDGLYITIGNTGRGQIPTYSCSVVVDGQRRIVEPYQIIEGLDPVEYPQEWMNPIAAYVEEQRKIAELQAKRALASADKKRR